MQQSKKYCEVEKIITDEFKIHITTSSQVFYITTNYAPSGVVLLVLATHNKMETSVI